MNGFSHLIPRYFESDWSSRTHSHRRADLEWPRIGIYCADQRLQDGTVEKHEQPWLIGSFVVADVLEEKGTVWWGWSLDFMTGDGYLIRVSGVKPQHLVGHTVRDRNAERSALRAVDLNDLAQVRQATDRQSQIDASARGRIPMKCGACGLARTFRDESVQDTLTRFWQLGFREVLLPYFVSRVDNRSR